MSLLSVVRDVAIELGLSQPTSAVSTSDTNAVELTYAVYRAGMLTAKEHDWSNLQVPATITGDGVASSFLLPTGFDRFSGRQRIMRGGQAMNSYSPLLSPDEITYFRATSVGGMTYRAYRRGGGLFFDPIVPSGTTILFEYQSVNWVNDPSRVINKARPSLDTDTFWISEYLLTLGAVWQWRKFKKLSFEAEQQEWLRVLNLEAGSETTNAPISTPMTFDAFGPSTPEQIG